MPTYWAQWGKSISVKEKAVSQQKTTLEELFDVAAMLTKGESVEITNDPYLGVPNVVITIHKRTDKKRYGRQRIFSIYDVKAAYQPITVERFVSEEVREIRLAASKEEGNTSG